MLPDDDLMRWRSERVRVLSWSCKLEARGGCVDEEKDGWGTRGDDESGIVPLENEEPS